MSAVGVEHVVETTKAVAREALRRPLVLVEQQAAFLQELLRIATGESTLAPDEGDRRFQDAAFSHNALYRAWLQAYLAWRNSARAFVDKAGLEGMTAARAQFLLSLLTEALAPTNFLLGNPAALKKAIDTGGASLLRGLQNMASDLAVNGGMPSMVDRSAFRVGRNLAVSASRHCRGFADHPHLERPSVPRHVPADVTYSRPRRARLTKTHQKPLPLAPSENFYTRFGT